MAPPHWIRAAGVVGWVLNPRVFLDMYDLNDTIVAVSSAAGGVRSILRVTGPGALAICEKIFAPASEISNRIILSGCVRVTDDLCVGASLYPFLAPHSYTGQDLIELHVEAAPCLVEALLECLLARGCRAAGPGEFTARAYLNGKLDLAQAEAVNEVISSSNALQLEAAERLLGGRLTKMTDGIRSGLLDILSLIEAGLDFSGEDIEFISAELAARRLTDIQRALEGLLAGSVRYESLMDLPAVGIAGAPNAGKSSLLNALLGWERSIVSPQARTTRDVLTGVMTCEGRRPQAVGCRAPSSLQPPASGPSFRCVLFDCAGLIPSPDNVLDELAQRAALTALQRCSAVLFCVDSAKADWSEDLAIRMLIQPKSVIHVATKSDLIGDDSVETLRRLRAAFGGEFLAVSATKRTGLEVLAQAIERAVCSVPARLLPECVEGARQGNSKLEASSIKQGKAEGEPLSSDFTLQTSHFKLTKIPLHGVTTNEEAVASAFLTARHKQAITEAVENVRQAIVEVTQDREEVAVTMIRAACEAISGLSQQHLDEQILDRIFSRFCVGK
ncbi:MAG: tRNA modification GTPase [Solirubrobacterales bacterium]